MFYILLMIEQWFLLTVQYVIVKKINNVSGRAVCNNKRNSFTQKKKGDFFLVEDPAKSPKNISNMYDNVMGTLNGYFRKQKENKYKSKLYCKENERLE